MGRSLTIGDPAAERVWPVVHMQAGLDPLPYLKTLARDDEVGFPLIDQTGSGNQGRRWPTSHHGARNTAACASDALDGPPVA